MSEVSMVHTPMVDQDAANSLVAALRLAGERPHQNEAALLLAHLWAETSGTHCYNNNPGNLSTTDKLDIGDYYRPAWYTVTDASSAKLRALHAAMLRGAAPTAFFSFDDLDAGLSAYVRQLQTRYRPLLQAAANSDPDEYASAIVSTRYTLDAPSSTASTLRSYMRKFLKGGLFSGLPLARRERLPSGPVEHWYCCC